jgi:xanthine dehydrogenase iron-sulfur cluster and FAD-binding subunit A
MTIVIMRRFGRAGCMFDGGYDELDEGCYEMNCIAYSVRVACLMEGMMRYEINESCFLCE